MTLWDDLKFRGLIKQTTHEEGLRTLLANPITLYCGFDPTADSLHVGSLLPLLTLRRFQLAGHRVIAVVGGATGRIGDPSFKAQERSLLTEDALTKNLAGIRKVLSRFLDVSDPERGFLIDNYEWTRGISFLDFLRDVGKHFTINHMIAKESVRARLEDRAHGISFTEFSYMLLQAYDFWYLHETHQCRLQIGGSDQWGNITAGTELIRRKKAGEESSEAFGLTHPLVTKADGTKFGKTESGTVWLSPEKTSPYQLYQFFIQTDDVDVFTYLRYFTFLSQEEILSIEQEHSRSPEQRRAQKRLAQEVLRLTYGEDTLSECESSAQALFSGNLLALPLNALLQAFEQTPSITVPRGEIVQGLPLLDALVRVGLCTSKGAARKEVQGGGININQVRVNDPQRTLQEADLLHGSMIVIRKGKKTYALLKVEN